MSISQLQILREAQMTKAVADYSAPLRECKTGLVEYASEFGLSFNSLKAEHMLMLLAARNLESLINSLKETPLSFSSTDLSAKSLALTEGEAPLQPPARDLPYTLPTDRMEVSQVTNIHDLPHILPHQWNIEDENPEVFWKQMTTGELLKRTYLDTADSINSDKSTQLVSDYEAKQRSPDSFSQRAIILLDISWSMNNNDHRGAVARGAALAFAKRSHSYEACMHLAPFREKVTEIISGRGQKIFDTICGKILGAENQGITNIQIALDSASKLLLKDPDFIHDDLLLITDGLSHLTRRPPDNLKLHTILIGDVTDRTHPDLLSQLKLKEQRATLNSWSTSFHNLRGSSLIESLSLKNKDLEELMLTSLDNPAFLAELESFLKMAKTDDTEAAQNKQTLLEKIERIKQYSAEHFEAGKDADKTEGKPSEQAVYEKSSSAAKNISENAASDGNAEGGAGEHPKNSPETLTRRASGSKVNDPIAVFRILYKKLKDASHRIREWVLRKLK